MVAEMYDGAKPQGGWYLEVNKKLHAAALKSECPRCGVAAGRPCVDSEGVERRPHGWRIGENVTIAAGDTTDGGNR